MNGKTQICEPEIGTDGSNQTRQNPRVYVYGYGFGLLRRCRSGVWTGLKINLIVFLVRTRTAGRLPGPVAITSHTLSCCPSSFSFPEYWLSSTPFQLVSFTFMLAKSIDKHSVWHIHCTVLGILDPRSYCLALFRMHCLPPSCLCCNLEYPSTHSNQANFWHPKCCQVCYSHHFRLHGGRCSWSSCHLLLEFVLGWGALQAKLIATVIFLTVYMQPHHQRDSLTRMLSWSL